MVGFWCLKVSICLFGGCFFCKLESLYISECIQNVVVRPLAFRQMQFLCFTLKCLSITYRLKIKIQVNISSPPSRNLKQGSLPSQLIGNQRSKDGSGGWGASKAKWGFLFRNILKKMWTWSYLILPFLHQHCPVDVNFTFAYVHFCPPSRVHATFFFFKCFFAPFSFFLFPFCNFFFFLLALDSWSIQLFSFLQIFNIAHFQGRQVYQIFVSTNIVSFFTLI